MLPETSRKLMAIGAMFLDPTPSERVFYTREREREREWMREREGEREIG